MKTHLLFLFALTIYQAPISSQNTCKCEATLIKDRISSSTLDIGRLYYYTKITKEDFETLSKSVDADFDYYKIISGSGSYDEFKQKLTKLMEEMQYNSEDILNQSYYSETTSDKAYDAFTKCTKTCTDHGLSIWIEDENEDQVTVQYRFTPFPGVSSSKYKIVVTENRNEYPQKTITFKGSGEGAFVYKRKTNSGPSNVSIVFNGNAGRETSSTYYIGKQSKQLVRYPLIGNPNHETVSTALPFIFDPKLNISDYSLSHGMSIFGYLRFYIKNNKVYGRYGAKMGGLADNIKTKKQEHITSQGFLGDFIVFEPEPKEKIFGLVGFNGTSSIIEYPFCNCNYYGKEIQISDGQDILAEQDNFGEKIGIFHMKRTSGMNGMIWGTFYNNNTKKYLGIIVQKE